MARLKGSFNSDNITGYDQEDRISGGYGNDSLTGAAGDDRVNGGRGNDVIEGGEGNDLVISRSDAGEAAIAQEVNATNDPNGEVDSQSGLIYASQAGLPGDDVLSGGNGSDTFRFDVLLNAKQAIIEKHTDANTGVIDWAGVTGENNLVHDHWLDGIGNDIVTDFNAADGDKIEIAGHTTEVFRIDVVDADGDGAVDDTLLNLRSNQGAAGAHDKDLLGTVTVLNNQLTNDDFSVDANSTAGIVRNISQINEAMTPYNPGGGTSPGVGTGGNADGGGATDANGGAGMGAGAGSTSGMDMGMDPGSGAASGSGMDMGGLPDRMVADPCRAPVVAQGWVTCLPVPPMERALLPAEAMVLAPVLEPAGRARALQPPLVVLRQSLVGILALSQKLKRPMIPSAGS